MRKTIRLSILLLVVAIIYFGYSAWIDSVAIYNIGSVQVGSGTNWNSQMQEIWLKVSSEDQLKIIENLKSINSSFIIGSEGKITEVLSMGAMSDIKVIRMVIEYANKTEGVNFSLNGFMGANSLMKTLLDPFKMVLVGGVFALFIPLTKQLLFGTIIGMKSYMKNRQSNVLYNYQKSIGYVSDLKTKLEAGNYEEVKASYAAFSGLAFKPEFLNNMMDEICSALIKERDLTIFAEPAQIVQNSLTEMYEKERMRSINGRGDELFFDLKRGYEYCAKGSKYSIAYYKSQQQKADNSLGWKIYSLEIFKFNFFLAITFLPSFILSGLVGGLVTGLATNASPDVKTLAVAASFLIPWVLLTILVHALIIFRNPAYASMKKVLIRPALVYYGIYLLTFITISAGCVALARVGDISQPGTGGLIWEWFSALGYLVLSSSLIFYVLATLVDSFKTYKVLTPKLLIDGIILPLIAWIISTAVTFISLYGIQGNSLWVVEYGETIKSILVAINGVTLIGFWIYLSVSSFLINNLISPKVARELRKVFEAEALAMRKAAKVQKKAAKAAK
ncbi:hypothetical protein [Mesoplasma corruscae]|uniref:Uncharacterized protein n=1 Tax=Mesoplasma corruscae TaxID=216874 RepID=A0A2S5RFU9_9MOLU|nr:hypothetical protein [Mesoplasma corruscae]PPE06180.1 hypothetical protein MCORR_v1c04840 [Mesoplasma corruscae]